MWDFLKRFMGYPTQQAPAAPYKVEPPEVPHAPTCFCGRSSTGFCTGLHKFTDAEWNGTPTVETLPIEPVAEVAPVAPVEVVKPKAKAKPRAKPAAKAPVEAKPKAALKDKAPKK
jgi:hypothetical protein